MLQQLHRRNAWRLHAEQHPGLPVNLPQGAEHRIAELQLHPQALVERCLADMREQTPRGFVGHFLGGCRTEQQQRVLAGGGIDSAPQMPCKDRRGRRQLIVRRAGYAAQGQAHGRLSLSR
ncbi:hypothetical protein D3C81_1100630 [compost metagenome]